MSSFTDSFLPDYDKLTTDINKFIAEQKYLQQEVQDYHTAMERVKTTSNPMVAFTMLMWMMCNQGLGQQGANTAVDGGGLQIQGDLTKLNGDIENITNQDAVNNSKGVNWITVVASHLDKMLGTLTVPTSDPTGPATTPQEAIEDAIGGTAMGALNQQFGILSSQIAGSSIKGTVYFDPSGNGKISSYKQLQDDLKQRGDTDQANEAEKAKTNAFNQNTSTTQSTNAASQEKISNDANTTKAVQAFVVDGFHAIMDVISAAVKATAKG